MKFEIFSKKIKTNDWMTKDNGRGGEGEVVMIGVDNKGELKLDFLFFIYLFRV